MSTDRITFQGPTEITESSMCKVTARFRDLAASADVTPTNVYYRVDDDSGAQVRDWTSATPGDSVVLTLTADDNANRNGSRQVERRTVSVMADRGLSTQFAASYAYGVRNQAWGR